MSVFGVSLAVLLVSFPAYAQTASEVREAFRVVKVIDGDTIDVEMEGKPVRVRLIGVDTPETAPELRQRFGKEARLFLKNLLGGEQVYLEYGAERLDKYGRTLAYVYRAPDALFVNLELVRQGYAQVFRKFDFKFKDDFLKEEQLAKQKGKGLWDPDRSYDLAPTQQTQAPASSRGPPQLAAAPEIEEAVVYVTRTGAKYHRDGCRHLSRSRIPMSVTEASQRYTPCKVCRP